MTFEFLTMSSDQVKAVPLKTSSILEFGDTAEAYEGLIDDIHLQRELDQGQAVDKDIYFDTSSIIDMLTGMSGLFKGGKINWEYYSRTSPLVYALAYRNWLGPIFTLPPHTEELINQIQNNQRRFPEKLTEKVSILEKQFWGERRLKVHEYKAALNNQEELEDFVIRLKEEAVDLFKGVYLLSKNSFWKSRYKYLVDERKIFQFSNELDYQLGDLTRMPLFTQLLKHLNSQRSNMSSNNYIDAIALCMLDQKLQNYYDHKSDTSTSIPIFFSDQEHILEAVKLFSQKPVRGRAPYFTYKGISGDYLIVRNANYFIIEGIMNALREQGEEKRLSEYVQALQSLQRWLQGQNKSILPETSENATAKITSDFQEQSEDKFFLEFFDRWWSDDGFDELKQVLDNNQLEGKRKDIDLKIHEYIDQERARINKRLSGYKGRISIIKKIWNGFKDVSAYVQNNFVNDGRTISVFKDFGPRFSYTEEVCEEVQILIDRIFAAVFHNDPNDLEDAKATIVSDIVNGLFGKPLLEEEFRQKFNDVAKGLAIFWIFEKFDTIHAICEIIREQYQIHRPAKDDMYPSASIALLHAAAILRGNSNDQKLAFQILHCVESKFSNRYNVWIGLSYLYYLKWDQRSDGFFFPELLPKSKQQINQTDPHLKKALYYSKMAIDWLEDRRNALDDVAQEKQKYRQRRYYYALNNFLFFKTLCATPKAFIELKSEALKLEECARISDYWQDDRFPDTLSRYFFRYASLASNKELFDLYLEDAMRYNKMAIDGIRKEKNIYRSLKRNLDELKAQGFQHVGQ